MPGKITRRPKNKGSVKTRFDYLAVYVGGENEKTVGKWLSAPNIGAARVLAKSKGEGLFSLVSYSRGAEYEREMALPKSGNFWA
jgi:hypothetical protein